MHSKCRLNIFRKNKDTMLIKLSLLSYYNVHLTLKIKVLINKVRLQEKNNFVKLKNFTNTIGMFITYLLHYANNITVYTFQLSFEVLTLGVLI